MFNITQAQLQKIADILSEAPTKFGLPVLQILQSLKKVEEAPIVKNEQPV